MLLSQVLWSQLQLGGIPESFSLTDKSAAIIPCVMLDSVNVEKMLAEDELSGISNRYGIVQPVNIDLKSKGISTEIQGKGTVWRLQLKSPDAYSIKIIFTDYFLPDGASLYLYNEKQGNIKGAFSALNNKEYSTLTLADFMGKNVIIEYFEPVDAKFEASLIIGNVAVSYRDMQTVAEEWIGINCPTGDDWQIEKNSVCLMSFVDDWDEYVCTGSLINNVREDETPYFLSANHCISKNSVAQTLVAYFNYENESCNSNDASLDNTLSGATLKATNSTSDFTLLLLSERPPDDYLPYYAGWDATGDNPESGVCIHHPEGEAKSICAVYSEIPDNDYRIRWDDRTTSEVGTHWDVYFDEGVTGSGSSGAPLFNEDHRIVGQLHGGDDLENLYGKFSLSWDYSSNASKQLKAWLDPDKTNVNVLDGIGERLAPKALFSSKVTTACIQSSVQLTDLSIYSPTQWLWRITPDSYLFVENTDSMSQNPVVEFFEAGKYTFEMIVSNSYGYDSLILNNYIEVLEELDVEFSDMPKDTSVCACDLSNMALVGSGAYSYSFTVSDESFLDVESKNDTLLLSLNENAVDNSIFNTEVIVTGKHGACVAYDTLKLEIIKQGNDNFEDAYDLHLGRNALYSNKCASIQEDEPSPQSGVCYSQSAWCDDDSGENGNISNTIWFRFDAPEIDQLTIITYGFNTQVALYESWSDNEEYSNIRDMILIAANDDQSSANNAACINEVEIEGNKTYWIQVDGNKGDYGDLTIDLIGYSKFVYPNSSTGIFQVLISEKEESSTADYSVYDLAGRLIRKYTSPYSIDNNVFEIDLSGQPRGVYLLKVNSNSVIQTFKLIVE